MISLILLAAGESSRMGDKKLLIEIGGKPMLIRSLETYIKSEVNEIIIVTGDNYEKLEKILIPYGNNIKTTVNSNFREGMASSIKQGMKEISEVSDFVVIALGDQPYILPSTIKKLLLSLQQSDKGIIIPSYSNRKGHPVVFSAKYFDQLKNLNGDEGARGLIKRNSSDVLFFETFDEGVLVDIDTPADLAVTQKNFEGRISEMDKAAHC